MSPRAADARVRAALIESAARLLAEEGPAALTTRRLASTVGVSTMALYTHFEDIGDLRRAVRLEWFDRLSEQLSLVQRTTDPVADLAAQGWAYFSNAVENKHMFRAMFVDPVDDPLVATVAVEALQVLVDSVQRCMDEGRLSLGDAWLRTRRIWMTGTGVVVACLAGFVTRADAAADFYETAWSLLMTFGDDPEAARASLARGRRRMERRTRSAASRPTRTVNRDEAS